MPSPVRGLINRLMRTGDVQRQSFLHFGVSVTITVLGFLSTMTITHLTHTPSVPGGYFLFLSYLGIFSLISSGGLGGACINRMGESIGKEDYFSTYLVLRIILLTISILLLIILSIFLVDLTAIGLLPWLVSAVVVTSLSDIAGTWLYGTGKAGYVQMSSLVSNLVRIFVQILAIIAGFGVFGLAGGVVAGIIIGTVCLAPYCRFKRGKFNKIMAFDLIRFSFWSLLASGGMVIYGNIDTILLGYFASTSEVGLYRIALQFASFSLFTTLALYTILYPKFASWQRDSRRAWISTSLARAISYSLLLALPVTTGGLILGDRLLYFLYGMPYQEAQTALMLLLIAQVVYVFVFLYSMTLSALDKPKSAAIAALIATALNIPLNLLLIPWFGIFGAAMAILITVIIHALCVAIRLKAYIPLTLDLRALRSICIATLTMACSVTVVVHLIPLNHFLLLAGVIFLGACIYFLILSRLEKGVDTALRKMMSEMGIIIPDWL